MGIRCVEVHGGKTSWLSVIGSWDGSIGVTVQLSKKKIIVIMFIFMKAFKKEHKLDRY